MPGGFVSPLFWNISGENPDEVSVSVWCEYTRQSAEAAQGWGWLNAVHPDDRESVRNMWKQAIVSHMVYSFFCRIRSAKGKYQRFKVLIIPIFNEEHQLQSLLVSFIQETLRHPLSTGNWKDRWLDKTLLTQSTVGVLGLSLDGTILIVNDRLCELTGYTEAELLSLTIWQLSMPEDVYAQLQAMRKGLAREHSLPPLQVRYRCKDGNFLWVRLSELPQRLPLGDSGYFLFAVEDVSWKVRADIEHMELLTRVKEACAEAEERARLLEIILESINDAVLVSDKNGQIIHSSKAFNRLIHLDKADSFLQLSLADRLAQLQVFDESGRKLTANEWPIERLLRGESLLDAGKADVRQILPDGEEVHSHYTGSTVRDHNNQIVGAVLVLHDITEHRRLEQHVSRSFSVLLALAEELVHIPGRRSEKPSAEQLSSGQLSPALSLQAIGKYLAEVACQMLEYRSVVISLLEPGTDVLHLVASACSEPQTEDQQIQECPPLVLSDHLDDKSLSRLQSNEVIFWDLTLCSTDLWPSKLLVAPMILDEHLQGILSVQKRGVRQDYTQEEISLVKAVAKLILLVIERERLMQGWIEAHSSELALREANRRFDEFLSIASHELRTPLAGIKGNIQLALRRLGKLRSASLSETDELWSKLESVEDYLRHAEHRVNVQNRMISDLLDVSRIQANKLELVMRPCNLTVIVNEAVEDQRYNAPGRLITLTMPRQAPLVVQGDADRIGQVIHNYLTNALKYSPSDQPVIVSIELDEQKKMAYVLVRDRGPGLTPEEQRRVWERFYRVKDIAVQSEGGPGLGLGLHISRTIVEAHNGSLGLESTPGEGSTFWFALPVIDAPASSSEETRPFRTPASKTV